MTSSLLVAHTTKEKTKKLMERQYKPWPALAALVVGFFMIMLDSTIVTVANPSIMRGLKLGDNYNEVIWVTSAYLLSYAVPLLITGRLGDRFGPKNLYLIGLVIFTLSSTWCGVSGAFSDGGITMLITARVVQGVGAALMVPQTMSVITRMFPPQRRGAALGIWGASAGVATLVGPLVGGLIVGAWGWEWIFFINIPVGVIAVIAAIAFVPKLPTHAHSFDVLGVILSAAGMFLLVFGIQEGGTYNWGHIWGPFSVWGLIIAGIVVLVGFIVWQAFNTKEPLIPLALFRDRNFSVSNLAISTVGFAATCMFLPLIFYFQTVRGMTPIQSALMLAPSSIISAILSPFVGRLIDRVNPKFVAVPALLVYALGLFLYSQILSPTANIAELLLPASLIGVAMSATWGPISTMATHNLPLRQAGAGSGVYNTTRQVGAVLGSASIAALIDSRLSADLPKLAGHATVAASGTELPVFLHGGFTQAMAQSMLLPAAVALLGAIVVIFWERPRHQGHAAHSAAAPEGISTQGDASRVAVTN